MPQCALPNEASISCFRLGEHLFRAPRVLMRGGAITERADQFDMVGFADCSPNRPKAYLPSEKKRYGDRFLLKYKFILARIFFGFAARYNLNNP